MGQKLQAEEQQDDTKADPIDRQLDQILGVIYGNALGDAIGVATEFMDSKGVKEMFGDLSSQLISFPNPNPSFHASEWDAGDWTDDTDQMILIMDSLIENKLQVNLPDFAKRLYTWMEKGFPELGDQGGSGIGFTVKSVLKNPKFFEEPKVAAREVWDKHEQNLAANGALMRTAILGCLDFQDMKKVVANTIEFCHVTHADTRCVASCIVVTSAIAHILQGKLIVNQKPDVKAILDDSYKIAVAHLEDKHLIEFTRYYEIHNVKQMKLDDGKAIGYTLKCMASALYGLRNAQTKDFKWIINDIVKEGGDADTNACVCGALIGAQIGYSRLPKDYIKAMPNKKWLDKKVEKFLVLIGFDQTKVQQALSK